MGQRSLDRTNFELARRGSEASGLWEFCRVVVGHEDGHLTQTSFRFSQRSRRESQAFCGKRYSGVARIRSQQVGLKRFAALGCALRRGEIARAGGAPYLHTLISSVPTAANAGYYAKIVRERAIMRRLVEAGTKIVQLGYSPEGDVDDSVDQAQAEVYSVTERRASEDYVQLSTL